MNIREKIKEKRIEMNLTQQELADQLKVSRSTVSNWEVGRNYPDIEMIVQLSNLLGVSLDILLKGDELIVSKIANDTKVRKKQSVKILVLSLLSLLILISSIYIYITFYSSENISSENQIEEITFIDNQTFKVKTKLPFYRSLTGWMASKSTTDNAVDVSLITSLDFKFSKKNEQTVTINKELFKNVRTIYINDSDGNIVKILKVKK